ncbi:hypothetical protein ACJ72_00089 [Emergomyces africanus]|uniref:Uncharacterized protein n=1 Tax=Emergomyces africanus TaxID=1955775 RepID=A0A1B7P951_9EURO|nr:hypothetical protein ACJ72_00089 [Emergomyces africanus]
MCSKGGPKQIDCREVLKNIEPVGTKKNAYCTISSNESIGPICIFNGAEYSVNDKNEVKFEASGTANTAVPTTTATSTLSFATATNYGSKATVTATPTLTFFPNSTTSFGGTSSSSTDNDDDETRTTHASTTTTESSSSETVLRSTKDVTVTIPPPTASAEANAPLRSASTARGALMANWVVGSLVAAFFCGNMFQGFVL